MARFALGSCSYCKVGIVHLKLSDVFVLACESSANTLVIVVSNVVARSL